MFPGYMDTGHVSLLQVSNLLESVCAGVSGSELGMAVGGSGPWGRLAAHTNPPPIPVRAFSPQLIPLQAPLKTLLQIGVMPMLNGEGWRV